MGIASSKMGIVPSTNGHPFNPDTLNIDYANTILKMRRKSIEARFTLQYADLNTYPVDPMQFK